MGHRDEFIIDKISISIYQRRQLSFTLVHSPVQPGQFFTCVRNGPKPIIVIFIYGSSIHWPNIIFIWCCDIYISGIWLTYIYTVRGAVIVVSGAQEILFRPSPIVGSSLLFWATNLMQTHATSRHSHVGPGSIRRRWVWCIGVWHLSLALRDFILFHLLSITIVSHALVHTIFILVVFYTW